MIKRVLLLYIVLMSALSSVAFSQHYIGVRGGATAASIRFSPSEEAAYYIAKPEFGVSYKYVGGDSYVGAIEVDFLYKEKAFKVYPEMDSDSVYVRSFRTVELPFLWQPHIYFLNNRARLFFNLGPFVSYHISSDWTFSSGEAGLLDGGEYEYNTLRDNYFEYGVVGGVGYGIMIAQRIEVAADFRYHFGFSDILKNRGSYSSNPSESPMTTLSVSMGVSYRFGK